MTIPAALDDVIIILVEPLNDINIGTAVRACRNFGISHMRLVNPRVADPAQIGISAPNAEDYIEANITRFDTLDEALADCHLIMGTSARSRAARRLVLEPRSAARHILETLEAGHAADAAEAETTTRTRAAVLFGREDFGLPNEALDRCHAIVCAPTNPDYSSLNLGQAVLLICWELFRAASETPDERPTPQLVAPQGPHPPVPAEAIEHLMRNAEQALDTIEFLKDGTRHTVLASLRSVFLRAGLDSREAAILHGMFSEVPKYLARAPIPPAPLPQQS